MLYDSGIHITTSLFDCCCCCSAFVVDFVPITFTFSIYICYVGEPVVGAALLPTFTPRVVTFLTLRRYDQTLIQCSGPMLYHVTYVTTRCHFWLPHDYGDLFPDLEFGYLRVHSCSYGMTMEGRYIPPFPRYTDPL